MATACDHIEHVRTQLPYALITAFTALIVGVLPSGYGIPWWASLAAGAIVLIVIVRAVGRRAGSEA